MEQGELCANDTMDQPAGYVITTYMRINQRCRRARWGSAATYYKTKNRCELGILPVLDCSIKVNIWYLEEWHVAIEVRQTHSKK